MIRSKTLVVGGSGFVGSYLMKELNAENMDLKEGYDVRKGIDDKYKTIVFLACNQANTQEAYKENHEMYKALDQYRRQYPKTHLIYFSSAAVYYPGSKYSQTKRLGEVFAKRFKKHTILRPSNIYGHGDGHGAPDKFMQGEKEIYGDGSYVRDLIAVESVVDQVVSFIESREVGVFNVSTGIGTSVKDMFNMFGKGKPKFIKHKLGRDMETEKSILVPGRVYE
jgi:nucleoside-diphosphate-sugar epimerase